MKNLQTVLLLSLSLSACLGPSNTAIPTIALSSDQASGGQLTVQLELNGPSQTRTVLINNNAVCPLTFTTSVDDTWMSSAPVSGAVAPNEATPVTVTIASRDDAGVLPIGTFLGTLRIVASCPSTGAAVVGSPAAVAIAVIISRSDAGVTDGGSLDAGVR